MRKRVVVAMSGGVDSSIAAALLKEKGFEVIGITMQFKLYHPKSKKLIFSNLQNIEDARKVVHRLNIKHYTINMQEVLKQRVIEDFCQEYLKGRTPNPCVRCNQYIKFGTLLNKSQSKGAEFLATGHYARIERTKYSILNTQYYLLKKAKDKQKDQSYFLYRLGQKQLKTIIFPLGNYTKDEVRKLARKFNLPVANKLASQEICFLAESNYRDFLKTQIKQNLTSGLVVDKQANILGQHKGIALYTIGQREGLGIAKGYPLYINRIDSEKNLIVVGKREEALKTEFLVKEPHFIIKPEYVSLSRRIKKKVALRVRIRYNHKEAKAEIKPEREKIRVRFKKPQFAITPGQSAVFYDKDIVVGGGIIDKVLD